MTNCTQSAPATAFVRATYQSFCDVFGVFPPVVWCDPKPKEEAFHQYRENLLRAGFKKIHKTNGLADGFQMILETSKADYCFILEHDWAFTAAHIHHSLEEIMRLMYKENIYYFRFNKNRTHICGWDTWLKEKSRDDFYYCLSPCWSGNPHIIDRKKCLELGLLEKIKRPSDKTMEKKLTMDVDLMGAIYGPENHPATVIHLDARGDTPKPHWTRAQVLRMQKKQKKEILSSLAVCIPWRPTNCRWRNLAKDFVLDYYSDFAGVFIGNGNPGRKFNISSARNEAAEKALSVMPGCKVLFFADSDTYVSEEQFKIACGFASAENRVVIAYDNYLRMDQKATSFFYQRGRQCRTGRVAMNHVSGAVAVPVALFKKVGGFDHRFVGWGGDDRAFDMACNTITGHRESLRIPGTGFHLFHPPSKDKDKRTAEYAANIALGMRYKNASGHPESMGILPETETAGADLAEMMNLLSGEGGPLHGK
jgi:glycosyltransferase involved in cell wall biosynthesis